MEHLHCILPSKYWLKFDSYGFLPGRKLARLASLLQSSLEIRVSEKSPFINVEVELGLKVTTASTF